MKNMKERLKAAEQRVENLGRTLQREEDELRGIEYWYTHKSSILGDDPTGTLNEAKRVVANCLREYNIWQGTILELTLVVQEMEEAGQGEWMV